MTRKHFETLADALKATKPMDEGHACYASTLSQWTRMIIATAGVCRRDNPAFDVQKFCDRCGV